MILPKPQAVASLCLAIGLLVIPQAAFAQQETEAQIGPIRVKLIGPETPVKIPDDVVEATLAAAQPGQHRSDLVA